MKNWQLFLLILFILFALFMSIPLFFHHLEMIYSFWFEP